MRKKRRSSSVVTLHDVAKRAGVSPMTVSRFLDGSREVRDGARVRAAIEELGYSPILPREILQVLAPSRSGFCMAIPVPRSRASSWSIFCGTPVAWAASWSWGSALRRDASEPPRLSCSRSA